jgi:hypothetical protein
VQTPSGIAAQLLSIRGHLPSVAGATLISRSSLLFEFRTIVPNSSAASFADRVYPVSALFIGGAVIDRIEGRGYID